MKSPFVSVMVPTRNSALTLERCLQSIRSQSYRNTEVIVIDNYSSDETLNIAKRHNARILMRGPERSAQLNFGVRNCKGEYVYRIDSDMVAEPNVVEEAVSLCQTQELDGVVIRLVSDPRISFWSNIRSYERANFYNYDNNIAIRFFSRRAFEEIGGFDEKLNGLEDYDLHDRFVYAGFHFGRIGSKEVHIGEPKTISEVVIKHYYYGKDLRRYLAKGGRNRQVFRRLSPIRSGQGRMYGALGREPRVFLGLLAYQSIRYLATALGMAFGR